MPSKLRGHRFIPIRSYVCAVDAQPIFTIDLTLPRTGILEFLSAPVRLKQLTVINPFAKR
jgi:hypothetical protein